MRNVIGGSNLKYGLFRKASPLLVRYKEQAGMSIYTKPQCFEEAYLRVFLRYSQWLRGMCVSMARVGRPE